jgi:opacity protein-like surface antigen
MKKFLAALLIVFCLSPLSVALAQQTTYEMRLEASTDISDTEDNAHAAVVGGLGWYHWERVLFGGYVSFEKKDADSYWGVSDVWGLGGYGEYHFNMDSPVVPYLGASLGFLDGDKKEDTTFVMAGSGGIKVFVTDRVAISGQLNLNWADANIYDYDWEDSEGDATDISANIGLRYIY